MLDAQSWKLSWHITRRNWAVYRKDFFANISPTLADPAFYLLSLGFGLGALVTTIQGHSYREYLAPGLTISTALFTAFFETSYGFYVRMSYESVFRAMLTTPIGVRELILGEFIWVALKGAGTTLGSGVFLALVGLMPHWELLPLLALVGVLVALPCGAIGLIASSWVKNINGFQTVYSFIIAPFFFFSGLFFPLSAMPPVLQVVAKFFPLAHGVELAQSLFWNKEVFSCFLVHGSILALQSLVLCTLGYMAVSRKLVN